MKFTFISRQSTATMSSNCHCLLYNSIARSLAPFRTIDNIDSKLILNYITHTLPTHSNTRCSSSVPARLKHIFLHARIGFNSNCFKNLSQPKSKTGKQNLEKIQTVCVGFFIASLHSLDNLSTSNLDFDITNDYDSIFEETHLSAHAPNAINSKIKFRKKEIK